MTCKEVIELMSAGIDGELEQQMVPEFTQHINDCRSCRHEYELEQITKSVIRRTVASTKVPDSVATSVRQAVALEVRPVVASHGFLGRLLDRPQRMAVFAFGAVGIVLAFLIITPSKSHRTHAQPNDANIVHQTYNNFDKVLNKSFGQGVERFDQSTLTATLVKCPCSLHVPTLKKCGFVAGLHSFYNDNHIAEFVFVRENKPVYVYEARLKDILRGGEARMDPNILKQLMQTGIYIENHQPDCSLVLRLVDSTVYSTVADMKKEELLALIQ